MTCLCSNQKTDLDSDLTATLAHISAIDVALSGGSTSGTKSYTFDSGTGRQQETFNSPIELLTTRDKLVATRNFLRRALGCRLNIHQRVAR